MKERIIPLKISYCNNKCLYFFHNFDDNENIWCLRLDKKILDNTGQDPLRADYEKRPFPAECPLQEVTE